MAASGSFTITGSITGLLTGSKDLGTVTISNAAAVATTSTVSLGSGNTTITVPTGAVAMLFVPAATNTATLTLKGANGDTGIPLSTTKAQVISFGSNPTVIIGSSAATTAEVLFL